MRRTHLKAKLEDLVDRTGRVEDMLEVLAGIYRERARTPDYAELRDDMLATAHVLHEASEAVAAIFGEEDEEALEHAAERAAERAAWQARHEEGRGNPSPRTASRRTASRRDAECQLDAYGLDDLVRTGSGTLYHGTNRQFQRFDMAYIRHDLINRYYKAPGIFLTPRRAVAEQYADAARNALLPAGVVADLARKNKGAGEVLSRLVHEGQAAWEGLYADAKAAFPDAHNGLEALEQMAAGVDPNMLMDVAKHIEGSRYMGAQEETTLFDLWNGVVKSTPAWVFDYLDRMGLDVSKYLPKVYTVEVFGLDKVLVTQSKAKAEEAKAKGYDAVVFCGSDLVGGVPEVVVFNPSKVKITKVEVVAGIDEDA